MRILVAIIDNKSNEIVGNHITMHKHVATAVRMFADIANDKNTMLNRHTADFDLVEIGQIDDDNVITPTAELILSGKAFAATKLTAEEANNPQLPLLREVK